MGAEHMWSAWHRGIRAAHRHWGIPLAAVRTVMGKAERTPLWVR